MTLTILFRVHVCLFFKTFTLADINQNVYIKQKLNRNGDERRAIRIMFSDLALIIKIFGIVALAGSHAGRWLNLN